MKIINSFWILPVEMIISFTTLPIIFFLSMSFHNEISREIIQKFIPKDIWPFRFKKIDADTFLLTNDAGKYTYLSTEEFKLFLDKKPWIHKRAELIQKWFIWLDIDSLANDFAKKNAFLATGPNVHIIIVTLRCNHKCKYCHASAVSMEKNWTDLDRDTAKKIVDTIFFTTAPFVTIEFQWWEPLVNWDIIKFIVEYAEYKSIQVNKAVKFALVSNMSLMSDDKLKYLLDHNVWINTSLDGDEKTHNFNRVYNSGNSYELTLNWIWKINQEYRSRFWQNYPITPLLTVTRETLKNWKSCIDTYIELWISKIFWRPLNPLGFWILAQKRLGYSPKEFLEIYEKVLDYIIEKNIKQRWIIKENYASIFLKKILTNSDPNYVDTRSPCGAVIWQVAYNFDGKIYSCDEGRMLAQMGDDSFCVGEVTSDPRKTYVDMINSSITKAIVSSSVTEWLPWYEFDAYKPYLGSCPVLNYASRGTIYPNYSMDDKRKIESWILDLLFIRLKNPEIEQIFRSWL